MLGKKKVNEHYQFVPLKLSPTLVDYTSGPPTLLLILCVPFPSLTLSDLHYAFMSPNYLTPVSLLANDINLFFFLQESWHYYFLLSFFIPLHEVYLKLQVLPVFDFQKMNVPLLFRWKLSIFALGLIFFLPPPPLKPCLITHFLSVFYYSTKQIVFFSSISSIYVCVCVCPSWPQKTY